MSIGLFGKLPAKRDFMAVRVPRSVLEPYENWLQSALAISQNKLGFGWEDTYLVAPIWRFWIGPSVFGNTCAGAIMPSVDKVGRYFPLTIMYIGASDGSDAVPMLTGYDDWYASVEEQLLNCLREDIEVDTGTILLNLNEPISTNGRQNVDVVRFKEGLSFTGQPSQAIEEFVTSSREAYFNVAAAARSFWWSKGPESGIPKLHAVDGLPDPHFFSQMLSGVLEAG
ncbi:MAG: type VI secretion system-associated protein TagF [Rhizobiaceae bacterium]